jgi:hypothetical protein
MTHSERHRSERIGWLRAAVLGANDGIVSTASLVVGVAGLAPECRSGDRARDGDQSDVGGFRRVAVVSHPWGTSLRAPAARR